MARARGFGGRQGDCSLLRDAIRRRLPARLRHLGRFGEGVRCRYRQRFDEPERVARRGEHSGWSREVDAGRNDSRGSGEAYRFAKRPDTAVSLLSASRRSGYANATESGGEGNGTTSRRKLRV